jgi:hypothetical protein
MDESKRTLSAFAEHVKPQLEMQPA